MTKSISILAIAGLIYPFFSSEEQTMAPERNAAASTRRDINPADVFQMLEIPLRKIGDKVVFKTAPLAGSGVSFFEKLSKSPTDATECNEGATDEATEIEIPALKYIAKNIFQKNAEKLFAHSIALCFGMQKGRCASMSKDITLTLFTNGFAREGDCTQISVDHMFNEPLRKRMIDRTKMDEDTKSKCDTFQDMKNFLDLHKPSIKVTLCPEERADIPRKAREEGLNIFDFINQALYIEYYLMAMQLFAPNPLSELPDGDFVMRLFQDDRKRINIRILPVRKARGILRGHLPRD